MLLNLDPRWYMTMSVVWREWFEGWMDSLGLAMNQIMEANYSPEAGVLWVIYLRLHPETNNPYIDPFIQGEPANDVFVFFLDKKPAKVNLWEWKRAMIAYQGDQGA